MSHEIGVTWAQIQDELWAGSPDQEEATMDGCGCPARACAFCGADVDHGVAHLAVSPQHHDPGRVVPGPSGPHVIHAVCWTQVLEAGRRAWHARPAGEQAEP